MLQLSAEQQQVGFIGAKDHFFFDKISPTGLAK